MICQKLAANSNLALDLIFCSSKPRTVTPEETLGYCLLDVSAVGYVRLPFREGNEGYEEQVS